MNPEDRLLVNSLPKSGTHLLAKAIELFGYREHFRHDDIGRSDAFSAIPSTVPIFLNRREAIKALEVPPLKHLEQLIEKPTEQPGICIGALTDLYVSPSILQKWLDTISAGRYILGHLPQTSLLSPILQEIDYRHVFIIRDPRAVIVSSLPFFLDTGKMPAQHFLKEDMESLSLSERLDFLLEGGFAPKSGLEIKSFSEVYRSMLLWREESTCLFLRFEELVGEKGGGSQKQQRQAIEKIGQYLNLPIDSSTDDKIGAIYNPNARTFRKGQVNDWKTALDSALVTKLSQYCEPLCIEAGYVP